MGKDGGRKRNALTGEDRVECAKVRSVPEGMSYYGGYFPYACGT